MSASRPEVQLLIASLFLLARSELTEEASVELLVRENLKHGEWLFYEFEYGGISGEDMLASGLALIKAADYPVDIDEEVFSNCEFLAEWFRGRFEGTGAANPISSALFLVTSFLGRKFSDDDDLPTVTRRDCAFVESVLDFLRRTASEVELELLRAEILSSASSRDEKLSL